MSFSSDFAQKVLSLIDLTSLNDQDTAETILALCHKAQIESGHVAALCVHAQFIGCVKDYLSEQKSVGVRLATVVNFPHGQNSVVQVEQETYQAVEQGATEIDLVMPYTALIQGDTETCYDVIQACRRACSEQKLKVIIESGALKSEQLIVQATEIAIESGADFIKTSTGKFTENATLSAAKTILETIARINPQVGFKVSGGIRTLSQAYDYWDLTRMIMGEQWADDPQYFRFGASSLLDDVMSHL
tara:strand:- start:3704 stop:4441 length:738 start_codon:yes stop_codon:yes gene_type:complete